MSFFLCFTFFVLVMRIRHTWEMDILQQELYKRDIILQSPFTCHVLFIKQSSFGYFWNKYAAR